VKRVSEIVNSKNSCKWRRTNLLDGRIFERNSIPIFIQGKYTCQLWRYNDITARKKIEAELKKIQGFL